jgi:hypothetical protein
MLEFTITRNASLHWHNEKKLLFPSAVFIGTSPHILPLLHTFFTDHFSAEQNRNGAFFNGQHLPEARRLKNNPFRYFFKLLPNNMLNKQKKENYD